MTTYYVAKSGSDSGKGTSGSPWKTISKAMKANLHPGDEVVVKSGVYKESVTINKDGNAGNYITIRSEVPAAPRSTLQASCSASTSTQTTSSSTASRSPGPTDPGSPGTTSITS